MTHPYEVHLSQQCVEAIVRSYLREQGFPVEGMAIRLNTEILPEQSLLIDVDTIPLQGIDVYATVIPQEKETP